MPHQLLWIETLLKLSGALVLLIAPVWTARLLGLPAPGSAFWPRLVGGLLLGLGAASYMQGSLPGRGLAPAGAIAINLAMAGTIAAMLVLRPGQCKRRGAVVLWLVVAMLVLLSLFELAIA